jgi:hypothetical protein
LASGFIETPTTRPTSVDRNSSALYQLPLKPPNTGMPELQLGLKVKAK